MSRANLDGLDVDLVEGSILDAAAVDDAIRGVDAIVHLAAVPSVPRSLADPVASHAANATGTVMILEAARAEGDVHVIVAGSSSVYGANPTLPKREDLATLPLSPYAASKLATEAYALSYQHSFGTPVLAFRFFNVFGPLQGAGHPYAAVVPCFVSAALEGRPVTVYGDGEQSRDFTYVGTVCDVIADAVERQVTDPNPVNLAFGNRTSLLELLGRPGVDPRRADRARARSRRAPATCGTRRPTRAACASSSPTSRRPTSTRLSARPSRGSGRRPSPTARSPARGERWATGLKRGIDVAVAAVGLIVLSPLLVVLAVLVRLRMGSPVLFRQVRPGFQGRPFELVKFRTMTDATHGDRYPGARPRTAHGPRGLAAAHQPRRAARAAERAHR